MLYRSVGNVLTVERQLGESAEILNRLTADMRSAGLIFRIVRHGVTRVTRRKFIELVFQTRLKATAAERWIENNFDVD